MPNVSGKVVLITGAARGIGAQTARELARRGARLALIGL
ncbi:SDR family NAD(P)-dependent oxidoreductase, partial [Saccharopolyspora kobensis]